MKDSTKKEIISSIKILGIISIIYIPMVFIMNRGSDTKPLKQKTETQESSDCKSQRDEIQSKEMELFKLDQEWKAARDDAASMGISNSEFTKDKIRAYRKAATEYEENKQELSENCKKLLGLQ